MKQLFHFLFLLVLSATVFTASKTGARAQSDMNDNTTNPAQGAVAEKRARTPAQRKIDTQLLYALYRQRGEAEAKGVPAGELRVKFDEKRRALVTIRARVTRAVLAKIKRLGGEVISSSVRYDDIRAHLPLEKMEELAALKDVRAIMPAEEATTNSAQ
jgi:hypothetical protein